MTCMSEEDQKIPPPRLRVHVSPVGFEDDRVVLPILEMKADKVYLIQQGGEGTEDRAQFCVDHIKERLSETGFIEGKNLIIIAINIFDLYGGLKVMAEIFGREQGQGNDIFFNASSGGHIVSFAGWLACMLWKGTPYYCSPDNWDYLDNRDTPLTSGLKEIVPVPTFHIDRPDSELLHFLDLIVNFLDENKKFKDVTSRNIADLIAGDDPNLDRSNKTQRKPREYNKVKWLVTKLIDRRYAEYADPKQKRIRITAEGKQALKVFQTYDLESKVTGPKES